MGERNNHSRDPFQPYADIEAVRFSVFTAEDVRKLSVRQVVTSESHDRLGNPREGGLYDPAFGCYSRDMRCTTCSLSGDDCPGHFGHIELAVPVFHPVTFPLAFRLLKRQCWGCHHFMYSRKHMQYLVKQFKLLDAGDIEKALAMRKKMKMRLALIKGAVAQETPLSEDKQDDNKSKGKKKGKSKQTEDEKIEDLEAENDSDEDDEDLNTEYKPTNGKFTHIEEKRRSWAKKLLDSHMSKCPNCGLPPRRIRNEKAVSKVFLMGLSTLAKEKLKKEGLRFPGVMGEENLDDDMEGDETLTKQNKKKAEKGRVVSQLECREHLGLLFENEAEIIDALFGEMQMGEDGKYHRKANLDMFFVEVVPVTPSRFRPAELTDGRLTYHRQNKMFEAILLANSRLMDTGKDKSRVAKAKAEDRDPYMILWSNLQKAVNHLFDGSIGTSPLMPVVGMGVKQILEKKQGLFRMNMMGKRVNFAARTVISPDANLQTDEIGVPQYFAERLIFKQPVTQFNYKELAQLVINGPSYPGALFVEDEFGHTTNLDRMDEQKRISISKTLLTPSDNAPPGVVKKVHRNLLDGDYVLMNRQPTLHKPSIMAHRAKVIRSSDRVLRMHYANCATYNADFDGDEMNLHLPQTFMGQAEARHIAATDYQYIVPRNGMPLRGLIQDYVVSGALLTKRDQFFTKDQFQKLLYAAVFNVNPNKQIKIPPPAILKPYPLWTGKQVVTATLNQITLGMHPITLECSTKIPTKLWGSAQGPIMNEGIAIFRENELVCGVVDKNAFGASAFGLVHCAYELYGPHMATTLLSTLSRLFVSFLNTRAFTCGIDDLLLKAEAEQTRRSLLDSTNDLGRAAAAQFVGMDKYDKKESQKLLNSKLANKREVERLDALMKNKLHPITSSVISACIPNGQVKLFPGNAFSMMTVSGAKGSQVNFSQVSCLLGQQELEGKRVPRMASGKTLPCFEPFDPTARAGGFIMDRFLTGIKPQEYFFHCMAGREGLIDTAVKTANSGYLQRCLVKNLENLVVNYDGTVRDNSDNSVVQFYYGEDSLDVVKTGFINTPKFEFFAANYKILLEKAKSSNVEAIFKETEEESKEIWEQYSKQVKKEKGKPSIEPPMTNRTPGAHLGSVSAKFHNALEEYISKNPDKLLGAKGSKLTSKLFRRLMWLKYQSCLVNPGEAVGLLAAQSVGEPSTQMTLNTFHLAGRGEANVTLGVPRLREIIMTASKEIKTPMMDVTMKDPTDKAAAEDFANLLQPIKLSEVVHTISTEESIDQERHNSRLYKISLTFIHNYKDLLKERHFNQKNFYHAALDVAVKVDRAVKAQLNRQVRIESATLNAKGKGDDEDDEAEAVVDDKEKEKEDEDDEVVGDEDGAEAEKQKKKKSEQTYEEDEEDQELKAKEDEDAKEDEEDEEEDKKGKKAKKGKKKSKDEEEEEEDGEEEEEEEEKKDKEDKKITTDEKTKKKREMTINKYSMEFERDVLSFTISIPLESRKVLMVSIVERILDKHFIKQSKGITRALVAESEKKGPKGEKLYSVQTEGMNFASLWTYANRLQTDSIYSNNIYGILKTYGVEAARALIMKEVFAVFKVYDITVDWRHLGLIADFMTFTGDFRGANRATMSMSASPFQKMTYESATRYLGEAASNADVDPLSSTSSRIVMGELLRSGTGLFNVGAQVEPIVVENYGEEE